MWNFPISYIRFFPSQCCQSIDGEDPQALVEPFEEEKEKYKDKIVQIVA